MNEDMVEYPKNLLENFAFLLDVEAGTAYLKVKHDYAQKFTIVHNTNTLIDYDFNGDLVGIELLNLTEGYPVDELAQKGSPLYLQLKSANSLIMDLI